jgi:epoxyqueuosine reductase
VPLGAQVYGCDICQDVCPWNRGIEGRRAGAAPDDAAHLDLVAWLDGDRRLDDELLHRLYVPRNEPRWLERNAIVALGNTGAGAPGAAETLARHAAGADEMLADHARWALDRLEGECC